MAGTEYDVVERSAQIGAPPARVFDAIVDLHEWEQWSPWEGRDPNMTRAYSGPDRGVGAAYAWEGNRKVGVGSMEITDATSPSRVDMDLEFLKPFKAQNKVRFDLEPAGEGTGVTWRMESPRTFMSRVMGVFMNMDKIVGKDFEQGLAQLDDHVSG